MVSFFCTKAFTFSWSSHSPQQLAACSFLSQLKASYAATDFKIIGSNIIKNSRKTATQMGLEPTTFGSEVRRAIHYATGPTWKPSLSRALSTVHPHFADQSIFTNKMANTFPINNSLFLPIDQPSQHQVVLVLYEAWSWKFLAFMCSTWGALRWKCHLSW